MALLKDIDLDNGLPMVSGAYLRVQDAQVFSKVGGVRKASFGLHFYASAAHVGTPLRSPEYRQFVYGGGDIDEEAYIYLKSLPEYTNAIDA